MTDHDPRADAAPGYPPPAEEVQRISTPEQFAALAHPLRQRLLFSLGRRPATISGLAAALGAAKGSVGHHLKVLREAGLVRIAETRTVRGGTEHYYQRTARRMEVDEPAAGSTAVMMGAVAQEFEASTAETYLTLRHLHLTPARARRLADTLIELVDEAEEDAEDAPVHGVLVALYAQTPRGAGTGADVDAGADAGSGGRG